jgi:hypothetical protein
LSLVKSKLSSDITYHKKSLAHCKRSVSDPKNSKGYEQFELDSLAESVDGIKRVIKEKTNRLKEVDKLLVQLVNSKSNG